MNSHSVTRRDFLMSSVAAGATLLLVGTSEIPPTFAQRPKHAILVDVSKCIACLRCVAGCETYHRLYENMTANGSVYTKVAVVKNVANVPELCLHCFDSPCTKACITHALTQLDYGPVVYDADKCIGCLLCVNQCPFGSITFDPVRRKIYKCVMCSKAVETGLAPYCVKVCPTGARSFGLYEDKLAEGMKLAEQNQGVLLYPRDTSILYVLTRDQFEGLVRGTDVTVIKDGYPADSRWIANALKYSRLAWIPLALGTAFYISKWTKREMSGGP